MRVRVRFLLATVGTIFPFTMKPSGALKLIVQLVMRGEVKVLTQSILSASPHVLWTTSESVAK